MRLLKTLLLAVACLCAVNAHAFCFVQAGHRYHIYPMLPEAIAIQESGLHPGIINYNGNRTKPERDYGLMQINSHHVPELIQLGIIHSPQDLLDNPCLNVQIGAWIMSRHLKTCGVNWNCLSSYNAGFSSNRNNQREQYAGWIHDINVRLNRMSPINR